MAEFTPPTRKKNALDNNKLKLSVPCPTAPGKFSSLVWGVYKNNPRITVYTGDPEDSGERNGYGAIKANLDGPQFAAFIEMCNSVIQGPAGEKRKIELLEFTFFGGKRSEMPVVVSEVWVGKDPDGAIWISVTAVNRPKIKFIFSSGQYCNLFHGDGTPLSKDETSKLFAAGYVKLISNLVPNVMVSEFAEIVPKQQGGYQNKGGGGGNNYQNRNAGGNQGYQSNPKDQQMNDIPF